MLRLVPFVAIVLARVATAAEPAEVRASIEKGMASMTEDAVAWKSERKCSSCHQVPMCLWTLNEVKKRGYTVDDKAVTELMVWVLDPADPAKIFPAQPPPEPPKPEEITVNQCGPKNKSASDTTPISYAATAWAVMGLARTVSDATEAK